MGHIARKAVLLILVEQLAEAAFGFRLLPQDFYDSLAGHLSAWLAMCLFALILARMYLYNSIDCFVPAEWPDPWEEAAEAYCYVEGAYAVPRVNLNVTGPDIFGDKVPQTYYYWLPIILLVLAVILKAPDLLWDMYCQQSTKQPAQTLKAIAFLTEAADGEEEVERLSRLLGEHLMSNNGSKVDFSKRRLFCAYLMSKALRIVASFGSLIYLQHSFGLSSPFLFGVRTGGPNEPDAFPTLTFCDVALRHISQWNIRTVQCVLPINLLLEKVAIFLWFWLVGCGLLCLCSTAVWLVRVGSEARRLRYVRTFAKVLLDYRQRRRQRRSPSTPLEDTGNSLVRALATVDRVFMLRLVQERLGMVAAYIAMEAMTTHYLRARLRPA